MRLIDADALMSIINNSVFTADMTTTLAVNMACRWIENAPTIEPEQQWIPVTERLPEDEEPILFSTTTGRVHQGRFHKDNSLNQWYSSLDKMRAFNNVVNAWMPLPTPWKGEETA